MPAYQWTSGMQQKRTLDNATSDSIEACLGPRLTKHNNSKTTGLIRIRLFHLWGLEQKGHGQDLLFGATFVRTGRGPN